jgi:hypothetical protein
MTKKQLAGEPASAASDLYALGLILRDVAGGVIHDLPETRTLERVCSALLQEDRRGRPDAAAALALLDHRAPSPAEGPPLPAAAEREARSWLSESIDEVQGGGFVLCVVETPLASASLLESAAIALEASGGLVLRGGTPPNEHSRYNVLDAAIDEVAALLLATLLDAELARDLRRAASLFPVLAGKASDADARPEAGAFDALVRILASLAGADGLYLLLDDFDRADADSLSFLDTLVQRRPAGVGVVVMVRGETSSSPARRWVETQAAMARRVIASPKHANAQCDRE